jgi:hypothetical protein
VTAYALDWSPGWGHQVKLGEGQQHVLATLHRVAKRNPSHTWHDAPPLRSLDRWPAIAHREIHRLVGLGMIALQATLPQHGPRKSQGCQGGLRFTFGVKRWRWDQPRRGQRHRMLAVPDGQLELGGELPPTSSSLQKPPETHGPPENAPPERPRTPEPTWPGQSPARAIVEPVEDLITDDIEALTASFTQLGRLVGRQPAAFDEQVWQ